MTDTAPSEGSEPVGRIAQWRTRAEVMAEQYQRKAEARPILGLPLLFLARYASRQGVLLASAAAFRLFLWLLPLALLTAGVLAGLSRGNKTDIESASKTAGLTGAASQQVVTALNEGHRSWVVAALTGGVLFLWTTRTLMRNLAVVNAHAWDARLPKPQQRYVLITTLIFAGTWIAVFAFTAAIHQISHDVTGGLILAMLVQGAVVSALWVLICRRLPDRRESWTDLIPGSLLVGFGLAIMNSVGRVYLPKRFAHSSALYGTLGIAAVMLAWLLLIGQLIVSAALVNAVWFDFRVGQRAKTTAGRPDESLGLSDGSTST